MEEFRWTRASYVAALVAGAITCLVIGMLVGVLASGGHPHNVLQVITDPAPAASAHDLQPGSRDQPAQPTQSSTTVTSTKTVTAPAKTVTTPPAQTVTETETQTVTEPAPTSTQQTTSP
jgi:cytoskeletal protein RodZ